MIKSTATPKDGALQSASNGVFISSNPKVNCEPYYEQIQNDIEKLEKITNKSVDEIIAKWGHSFKIRVIFEQSWINGTKLTDHLDELIRINTATPKDGALQTNQSVTINKKFIITHSNESSFISIINPPQNILNLAEKVRNVLLGKRANHFVS